MANLMIHLMDHDYNRLMKAAEQVGKSVQELVYDWISQFPEIEESFDVTNDPVFTMEGYESDAPKDLSLNLDKYLYGEN